MRRIATPTRLQNKFGAGRDGFTNGDLVAGLPATDLEAEWFDAVQEEIATVIEAAGLTLDATNNGQLLAAIQELAKRGVRAHQVFDFGSITDPTPGDDDGFDHLDLGNLS
ncbi:tail fiber protein [Bordetella ansorpii]|uniref:Tail fiber protein n=1 Tax=Bordetella ansorpii TaxID=288768 RepID=A0A157SVR7_9BORD|nr:hypothetical protein [Bordetella ansorpii]SAI74558.1 tail fiber protein [Bordetella ansorpii]